MLPPPWHRPVRATRRAGQARWCALNESSVLRHLDCPAVFCLGFYITPVLLGSEQSAMIAEHVLLQMATVLIGLALPPMATPPVISARSSWNPSWAASPLLWATATPRDDHRPREHGCASRRGDHAGGLEPDRPAYRTLPHAI